MTDEDQDFDEFYKRIADRAAAWEALPEEEKRKRIDAQLRESQEEFAAARRRRAEALKAEIIPRRFDSAVLDESQFSDPLLTTLATWVAALDDPNFRPEGLLLAGPTGVGKTHAIWALVRAALDAGFVDVEVRKVVGLLSSLRPGGSDDDRIQEVSRLSTCRVLFLDDLGAEKTSEWVVERLYEILDTRYEAMRPTVITTNVPLPKLYKAMHRVGSRLSEMCQYVEIRGEDRRT